MVNFSIKNGTNDIYALSVYINDNRIYYINSERENSLTLNYLDISKECKDDKQICCIYFLLEANNKIESSVEFKVLSLYSEQKSDNNNNNNPNSENFVKKNLNIILIIIGGIILILIIILLILRHYKRKNNSDLSLQVDPINKNEEQLIP